jgi:hypothetical protein
MLWSRCDSRVESYDRVNGNRKIAGSIPSTALAAFYTQPTLLSFRNTKNRRSPPLLKNSSLFVMNGLFNIKIISLSMLCYDHNFLSSIFGENGVLLKTNVMFLFSQKLAVFWAKTLLFFQMFCQKYFFNNNIGPSLVGVVYIPR